MHYVSTQGVAERAINVHYYYYKTNWTISPFLCQGKQLLWRRGRGCQLCSTCSSETTAVFLLAQGTQTCRNTSLMNLSMRSRQHWELCAGEPPETRCTWLHGFDRHSRLTRRCAMHSSKNIELCPGAGKSRKGQSPVSHRWRAVFPTACQNLISKFFHPRKFNNTE